MRSRICVVVLCGVALCALGIPAPGQEALLTEGPPEFYGGDANYHFIAAEEFASTDPEVCMWKSTLTDDFWYSDGGSGCVFSAALRLPSGALVTNLLVLSNDHAVNGDLTVRLRSYSQNIFGGTGTVTRATWTSSGIPGVSLDGVDVDPDFTVNYRTQAGAITNYISYTIEAVAVGTGGSATSLRGVIVNWKRQVSPAPATATFGDVPTSHTQFRFVEALAASGITGGCGGGDFCPDNPVTRGQMAVFLATALGLHYAP